MTEELYLLSRDDVRDLRSLLAEVRRQRTARPGRDIFREDLPSPDTYAAAAPPIGIPALENGLPGTAECPIYQVVPDPNSTVPTLRETGFNKLVLNLSTTPIPPNSFVPVSRDKFGHWLVMGSSGGGQAGTSSITEITGSLGILGSTTTYSGFVKLKAGGNTALTDDVADNAIQISSSGGGSLTYARITSSSLSINSGVLGTFDWSGSTSSDTGVLTKSGTQLAWPSITGGGYLLAASITCSAGGFIGNMVTTFVRGSNTQYVQDSRYWGVLQVSGGLSFLVTVGPSLVTPGSGDTFNLTVLQTSGSSKTFTAYAWAVRIF